MILLFNKIYLKTDRLIKGKRSRIVISKTYAPSLFLGNSIDIALSGVESRQALYQANTVDELITTEFDGDPNKFFQFLYDMRNDERLTIYCDADAMVLLLFKFWKTLYSNVDADYAYMLLDFHLSHLVEVLGQGYTSFANISPTSSAEIRNTYSSYLDVDREAEVKQMWDDTVPWLMPRGRREDVIKGCALELQLCNVLIDPAWRYKIAVQTKVVTMLHKQIIHEYTLAVKYVLLAALANFKEYEPGTTFDLRTHTLDQLVEMYPQYKFLTDARFVPDEHQYVFQTYDFDVLRQIYQNVVREQHGSSFDWAPMLTNQHTLEALVAFETSSPTTKMFLNSGDYEERINPYMIQWIFDSVRASNVQRLSIFKL